jgi:hypothetical protein
MCLVKREIMIHNRLQSSQIMRNIRYIEHIINSNLPSWLYMECHVIEVQIKGFDEALSFHYSE